MPGTGAAVPLARIGFALLAAVALLAMRPLLDVPAVGPVLAALAAVGAVAALRPLLPRRALLAARGLPSVIAGGITTVGAVSWAAGSELQSRLSGRLSDHRTIGLGAVSFFVGATLVGIGTATALIPVVVVGWLLAGLGIGTAYPRLSTATLSLSAPEERGRSSAALQIGDGFGSGLALTLVGVVTAFAPDDEFVGAFGLAALLGLAVLLIAPRTATGGLARR